ncbi:unnamed protein product [Phytomonas sp. Hart1]|nr:unnamed protein product [Phytomonas sp. Hart1]|eukprot:CCW68226.1 unnamed protein product [Phytomonas sp. isolate Hart1]
MGRREEGLAECKPDSPSAIPRARGIPYLVMDQMPEKMWKRVENWEFRTTRLDRISGKTSMLELERDTGVSAFPEIQFPSNAFAVSCVGADGEPVVLFDLLSILKNAAEFYATADYREKVRSQIVLPVSEGWAMAPFDSHDPGVDWAWRHRYYGIQSDRLRPLEPGMRDVDWDLLRNNALPIVFFGELDFFEDDLHDFGMVRCSVKFRVMTTAFYILFRHFVRLDHHMIWMRDVRIFHKFGETRAESGVEIPHIVVVEQFAKHDITQHESLEWKDVSPDEAFKKAILLSEDKFCVDTTPS